ncbi:hypothetical protein BSKO_01161 [Bryopsis sp. KO-2023]|nr:hypothetical protein BSKO_01161 [Bryopsis sp. KO-2023]
MLLRVGLGWPNVRLLQHQFRDDRVWKNSWGVKVGLWILLLLRFRSDGAGRSERCLPGEPSCTSIKSVDGRKGSVITNRYETGQWKRPDGSTPSRVITNEEVAKAVYDKVLKTVEVSNRYYHVFWYSLFVAAYLIVLYVQAQAFKSGDVVTSLRNALMPNGQLTVRFKNEDEVLAYIGNKIILPIWKDPICGDSKCEWPWEYPSFGRFGCRADCGIETNTTRVMVNVRANFANHPTLSPRILMANAKWNLCMKDEDRRKRGEADICWYSEDVEFDEIMVNKLETMELIDGTWYVKITGDYAGRVSGRIFNINNTTNPVPITLEPKWEECKISRAKNSAPMTNAVRRLLSDWAKDNSEGKLSNEELAQGLLNLVKEEVQKRGLEDRQDVHMKKKKTDVLLNDADQDKAPS